MRSIPISAPLPRIRKKRRSLRPQSSGLLRRSAVKLSVQVSRAAGIGLGGAKIGGIAGVICLAAALGVRSARAMWQLFHALCSLVGAGILWVGHPLDKLFDTVRVAALGAVDEARAFATRQKYRRHGRMAPLLCMTACTILVFATSCFGLGLEVEMNGVSLGFVGSRDEVAQIIREVEARAGEYMGAPVVLSPDISFKLGYYDKGSLLDANALKNTLFATVNSTSDEMYLLKIDGQVVGGSTSRAALENMLGRVKKVKSFSEDDVKTEFVKDVHIEPTGNVSVDLSTIAEMEALLTSNSVEVQTYSIKSGDTISGVAKAFGMTVGAIKTMNPELNVDRISIGETVNISAAVPYISIRQMRTETYRESIPFDTIVEYSETMYTNQSKITKEGVPGLADVTADLVYIDGVVSHRDVLEYSVIHEPQSQVKLVGTKKLPAKAATGNFIKPSNGKFSSGYGYRKNLGDYHTGVDFAGKVGSAVWAADGGTVTFAGWKGNYGYCVIINHGNGYETLYAHNSSLLVKQGQKVAKGEQIAKVGNTGRSTGPHVHFEIKINGKNVNPLNYISK